MRQAAGCAQPWIFLSRDTSNDEVNFVRRGLPQWKIMANDANTIAGIIVNLIDQTAK
jgi:hypothetical protein